MVPNPDPKQYWNNWKNNISLFPATNQERPYEQLLRTLISYLCWCPFKICNNLVEATAGLQRDVTAAVLVIKNKGDSLLWRQKFPCKFFEKKKTFYCIDMTTNMAALSRGCKPRIAGDY